MDRNTTLNNAISYASAGHTKKAVGMVKEILAHDPKNDRAWVLLADLCGEPAKAQKYLEKALQINPKNQQVCNRLAGYISTSKCQEVLGISYEEFQSYLGAEAVPVATSYHPIQHVRRKKNSLTSVNLPLFMILVVTAAFLYLARPNIQWPQAADRVQAASAQGSGTTYQVNPPAANQAGPEREVNPSSNRTSVQKLPAPSTSSISSGEKFVPLLKRLDEWGAKLLNIPNR